MEVNAVRLKNSDIGKNGTLVFIRSPDFDKSLAYIYYLLFVIACLLIAGCVSTSRPAPVVDRALIDSKNNTASVSYNAGGGGQYYIVQGGDTLYSIASNHGISLSELADWNNITDPSTIKPGQQITLLSPPKEALPTLFALQQQVAPSQAETVAASSDFVPDVGTGGQIKTEPKGVKLPYSDQALAQIQRMAGPSPIMPIVNMDSKTNTTARIEPAPIPVLQVKLNDSNIEWIWPAAGELLEGYSKNSKGVRISGKSGQPIMASAAGTVVYSGNGLRGYGNLIIIKHNNTFLSAYAYNSKLLVKEGDAVAKGQAIAEMGNTDTDTVKLHFEIRKHGKPVDPLKFLPRKSG